MVRSLDPSRALRVVALSCSLSAMGCFDVRSVDPGLQHTRIEPDTHGWVSPLSNNLDVTGFWYAYGDQYDEPKRCTVYGAHTQDQCSFVALPRPLPALDFPNTGGKMCTSGNAAKVIDCVKGKCDGLDYSNMWGAGIGLDFQLQVQGDDSDDPPVRDLTQRSRWDAVDHGVVGVAFDFSWTDFSVESKPYVRVEFPVELPDSGLTISTYTVLRDNTVVPAGTTLDSGTASEEHPSGSPFVDAPPSWGTGGLPVISSVREGHNEFRWSEVKGPPDSDPKTMRSGPVYPFEPSKLLGILFQVPPLTDQRLPYGFCVENFAFLRE